MTLLSPHSSHDTRQNQRATGLLDLYLESARTLSTPATGDLAGIRTWLAQRAAANTFAVTPVPFAELDGWSFDEETGDLGHRSGGFFRICGMRVSGAEGAVADWAQPIIHQPEVGVLGILVKRIDGVLCLLMQAKMEPGNINTLQLSPTVQATRSNFRRLHGGAATRHLEYFTEPGRGRVLADVLHSEQGGSFYRKRNRNIIVETDEEITPHEDYRWFTVGQLLALLREDNLVNMDARSVLSCLPLLEDHEGGEWEDLDGLTAQMQRELNDAKSRVSMRSELIPLRQVEGWHRTERAIGHESGRFFEVIGVSVQAGNREVRSWSQPLIASRGDGVVAFVASRAAGFWQVLVQARPEGGLADLVELAPTVQCTPANYDGCPPYQQPRYLDLVRQARPEQLLYDVMLSEEGGRFYQVANRYMLVEVDDEVRAAVPPQGYFWSTARQLSRLVRHSGYLNVEARSLLACLRMLV
jgi:dTDP-4-dehydro-6-deoxy-alpha-D-glucopyranose 2,3-dehydratase